MSRPLIDVADLTAMRLDGIRRFQLHVPAFQLMAGDRVAILAPSGSGKSTFLETLAAARAPISAKRFVVTCGEEMIDIAAAWRLEREGELDRLRAQTFGYVQQAGGLLEFLTVAENIGLSQRLAGRPDPDRVAGLARALGIDGVLRSHPPRLSGGQRQRVAIARALAHRPLVVVADEPTAALDRVTARGVMDLLCRTSAEAGTALLVATHDAALARDFDFTMIGLRERVVSENNDQVEAVLDLDPALLEAGP